MTFGYPLGFNQNVQLEGTWSRHDVSSFLIFLTPSFRKKQHLSMGGRRGVFGWCVIGHFWIGTGTQMAGHGHSPVRGEVRGTKHEALPIIMCVPPVTKELAFLMGSHCMTTQNRKTEGPVSFNIP